MSRQKNAPDLSAEVLANGTDGDQEHQKKLSRYAKAKAHQESVSTFILQHNPELHKELADLQGCSNTLIFRHWYTVNTYRLIGGCTCKKHLLCAMCALRRSAKTVMEVEKKIHAVLAENPHLVPVLITTTVKNGDDLGERYEHITQSKKKLLHSRRNAIHRTSLKNKSVTRFIHGSFGSYEFKKGSGGHGWHPHSHEIALVDPAQFSFTQVQRKRKMVMVPLEFERLLQEEWHKITSDSFMVDVRRVTHTKDKEDDNSLLKAICEASKYALKLNDIEHEDQVHAYKVLRGRRLTFTYGSLWGIKIPDDLHDTIEDELQLLPYVDLLYSFYSGKFQLTDVTDTGDTLFNSKARQSRSKRSPGHERLAAANRFANDVKNYVQERGLA